MFEITKEEYVKAVECGLHPTLNIAYGCNPEPLVDHHGDALKVRVVEGGWGVLRGEAGTPLVFPFRECDEGNLPPLLYRTGYRSHYSMLFFTGLPAQCPMVPIAMYICVHITQLGVDQDQNTICMSDVHIFPPMQFSSSDTRKCNEGQSLYSFRWKYNFE